MIVVTMSIQLFIFSPLANYSREKNISSRFSGDFKFASGFLKIFEVRSPGATYKVIYVTGLNLQLHNSFISERVT